MTLNVNYTAIQDKETGDIYPICNVYIYNEDMVHSFTIECSAIDDMIDKLSPDTRGKIIRAFARDIIADYLTVNPESIPINAHDFIVKTRPLITGLFAEDFEVLERIKSKWREYDQKRGETK